MASDNCCDKSDFFHCASNNSDHFTWKAPDGQSELWRHVLDAQHHGCWRKICGHRQRFRFRFQKNWSEISLQQTLIWKCPFAQHRFYKQQQASAVLLEETILNVHTNGFAFAVHIPVFPNTHCIFVYLSFAVLVASLHREFVQHRQQVEGLLWLEGEQVEIHQQEAHRLCKLFF